MCSMLESFTNRLTNEYQKQSCYIVNIIPEYGGEQHSLTSIKNVVCQLADNGFLMPIDRVTNDIVPRRIPLTEIEKVSKIDMAKLTNLYRGTDSEFPRNELYWTVNYDRFLIEIR